MRNLDRCLDSSKVRSPDCSTERLAADPSVLGAKQLLVAAQAPKEAPLPLIDGGGVLGGRASDQRGLQ